MKPYEVLLAIDCLLKVHWSILNVWTKDVTVKRCSSRTNQPNTLKKFWLHRSMSKLLSLTGDTLFMLEKRCGIRKVIIQVYAYAKIWGC